MSSDDDLQHAVTETGAAYHQARSAVSDNLGSMERDDFDEVFSLAEEFGARHVRQLIEYDPGKYGLPGNGSRSPVWFDELEQKLQRYVDANHAFDAAVAEQEQHRLERGGSADVRTIAFHGELPVVDLVNKTVKFPGRPPEALVLREGTGPATPQPERDRSRNRQRGRGR
jgi:hypothetical protein